MTINHDIIIFYLRLFVLNMCVYYSFVKILNIKENYAKNMIVTICINLILLFAYVLFRNSVYLFWPFVILCFTYGIILSKITKRKMGLSIIITIVSYAISFVCQAISVIVQFIPYKLLYNFLRIENKYLNLVIISIIQLLLIYVFFKIKRFRNGFSFLNNKLNNEITDIMMINISIILILTYCLTGAYYDEMTWSLLITFIVICTVMIITIQKMLTMYYKQKLLYDTMNQYKEELIEKQNEIDKLKGDKENISKITHEFYNRQKALELLVTESVTSNNIDKQNVSPNVLKMIESLTSEYSKRFDEIKELPKLEISDIPEIDSMFKYMQNECVKNNIDFKLKIVGNIHSLVNNVIPKNKLETLIGDHMRDAINAANLSETENKEILAVLGVKNKKYELSIFDTGVDFTVETLLNLGLKPVTTNKERGGTGTGFMTTFETMKEFKASLLITEYPLEGNRHYTKCVTIRFDGKNQYKICSYRAEEINNKNKDKRIMVEEYKN